MVPEPSIEESIEILQGLKHRYEAYHGLKYTDEALEAAAKLAEQYINDRFLPDKAIDLIDEAGSCRRLAHSKRSAPPPDAQKLKSQLNTLKLEKAEDLRAHNFEHAAELRSQIEELEKKLEEMTLDSKTETAVEEDSELVVTEEHIANIVARWTGVPVEKVTKDEMAKLLHLEDQLHEKVIGQDEAVRFANDIDAAVLCAGSVPDVCCVLSVSFLVVTVVIIPTLSCVFGEGSSFHCGCGLWWDGGMVLAVRIEGSS